MKSSLDYPEVSSDEVIERIHGKRIVDSYRWLEDINSKETKDWIEKQNTLTLNYSGEIKAYPRISPYNYAPGLRRGCPSVRCQHFRILVHHIIPNIIGPIVVLSTMDMGTATLTTAALSFLGVGISPPTPEWGLMVNTARPFMRQAPHVIIFPGMAIFVAVLAFNILGDGLRDLLDVRI